MTTDSVQNSSLQTGVDQKDLHLPKLRADLQLNVNGRGTRQQHFTIYDPVQHAFHALNAKTFRILRYWQEGKTSALLSTLHKNGIDVDETEIATVSEFVYRHGLADTPRDGTTATLVNEQYKKKQASWRKMLHAYVFFRIPLMRPQSFLNRMSPYVDFLFRPSTWMAIGVIGLIALYLALRQWDQFTTTFFGLLSPEGIIGYTLAIILTKIAHELGHAFAAHRYGCKVTSLGVGVMLMFPILYADTTDAWRLTSRRKRMVVGAAGMGAELIIAVIATLAWSFLADGALRSTVFFLATTSWLMTLLVNLNPFMRFDGYYLLADFLNFQNLQPRSNALARWWLRETLFAAGEDCPEELSPNMHKGLIVYAVCVWIYRFFLFLGIALILHSVAVKALALILSAIEIGWFIVRPVILEISQWPAQFAKGRRTRRLMSIVGFACLIAILVVPWQNTVTAPAVIGPPNEATIFSGLPGQIETIYVGPNDTVKVGDKLIGLHSPALETQITLVQQQITLLEARLNRRSADAVDRAEGAIIARELEGEKNRLAGFMKLTDDLIIRAPISGKVHGIAHGLHVGRWVNTTLPLFHLTDTGRGIVSAFVSEDDIARLSPGTKARFYADDPLLKPTNFAVSQISPTGSMVLEEKILSSSQGGALAVRPNNDGDDIPVKGVFRVQLDPTHNNQQVIDRDVRGIVRIKGKRRSPVEGITRRAIAIFNRETLS